MRTISIGNGAAFWGDNLDAPLRLVRGAHLDYLTLEYLAELTLSILAHLQSRDKNAGYVTDFPTVLADLLPELATRPGLKIVTNAGGMNPEACARQCAKLLLDSGQGSVRLAIVAGDDLRGDIDRYRAAGEPFRNFDTGAEFEHVASRLASANAYLGADGIARALDQEARIVITGRVADASLIVGPALHEFRWQKDEVDRLASATVAGHLIECGSQVTGGMFSGWTSGLSLHNLGYPIAEIGESGDVVLTKPPGTGGCVTRETVSEQLIYEIGDPAHYLTPDVDADFSQVTLTEIGPDRVRVAGARGGPAPAQYKVSMSYRDGYMAAGTLVVCGDQAAVKARCAGALFLERLQAAGRRPSRTEIEVLGAGETLPGVWPRPACPQEVVLRIAAHDISREVIERFVREFSPLVSSGPPGVTGYTGPRPQPYPVFAYWPTVIDRERVVPRVETRPAEEWL